MSNKFNLKREYTAAQLYQGLLKSEPAVLEYLYRQNFAAVRRYVIQNSGSADDARDIYQEAILTTWLQARDGTYRWQKDISPEAYIYQVARHKWLDRLKSARHRKTLLWDGEHSQVEDEEENPVAHRALDQRYEELIGLYNRLDTKCQELLDKFYFEKKSMKQIARETGYDPGSLRTIKYRCMQKLRQWQGEIENQEKHRDEHR